MKELVGASLLNIITESLYDKPIVVFREYIQNSADSLANVTRDDSKPTLLSNIWIDGGDLFFLDNGTGISQDDFRNEMIATGSSNKSRTTNMGYKGIGRLSGISYCRNLEFINIISFSRGIFQKYKIDCDKLESLKNSAEYAQMGFIELMENIGNYIPQLDGDEKNEVMSLLHQHRRIFDVQDTGFLVKLEDISLILKETIKGENFIEELEWLLPVPFDDELYQSEYETLFNEISIEFASEKVKNIPAKGYRIFYKDERFSQQIKRPIKTGMLRDYVCKSDFNQYAVSFHSFHRDKINIDRKNIFSGIKIYIDNMLLCDETELVPILQQYGLIEHGVYELIQSVKGIGAMIYIVDKVNISANARRTFIEITDDDSWRFLKLMAEFINSIYDARYSLSKYNTAKNTINIAKEKLDQAKEKASITLKILARSEIIVEDQDERNISFHNLNATDQKKYIKKVISQELGNCLRTYLAQVTRFNPDTAYDDFKTWLSAN